MIGPWIAAGRRTRASIALALAALALSGPMGAQLLHRHRSNPKLPPVAPADMTQAPAVGPVPAYTPPIAVRDQLPNGLHIVVVPDTRFPLVTVRLAVRAGSSLVAPADAGLAEAEATLLTAGTPTRSARQIAEEAEAYGGTIAASADPDFITVSASCLANDADHMFALLADVALNPSFPASEVELRKKNMLDELRLQRSEPDFLAEVVFRRMLFGSNPYAVAAPTEASIGRISRESLEQYHQEVFLPNNDATLVVVGDIDSGVARSLAERYFLNWRFGTPPQPKFPAAPERRGRRIFLVDRPGSAQSTILLGNLGVTRDAPDYFPFLVANGVLGGSFNSRLVADVREQKGYAYDIGSFDAPHLAGAGWRVETEVRTAVTASALQETLEQMQRIRTQLIPAAELAQAKNYLAGSFVRNQQTDGALADEFLTAELYHLPTDYLASYLARVQAVTTEAAQRAAGVHITPDHELIVVVGDAKQIEAKLANFSLGAITIFNEKGEVIGSYPSEGIRKVPSSQ